MRSALPLQAGLIGQGEFRFQRHNFTATHNLALNLNTAVFNSQH